MVTSALRTSTHRQRGSIRPLLFFLLIGGVVAFTFVKISGGKVAAANTIIKSGISGYCLDDHNNDPTPGNKVDLATCTDTVAQNWLVNGDRIVHNSSVCLSVEADRQTTNTPVVASACSGAAGQVWLQDHHELFNPNSGLCLTAPDPDQQLVISTCDPSPRSNQIWTAVALSTKLSSATGTCSGTEGARVACYAEKEWETWQSGTVNHNDLLNTYTDGAPYEAWCADFVSYVYKEAGHPFAQAYDGWDENNADNVQNYGFTVHMASSGYIPKPGDIAYFDYTGGHVEIVVSGGKTPTFIYGNSATIDPATGNGQMEANTITSEGSEGGLAYYLSPN